MIKTQCIIIGASIAGLASTATLQKYGIDYQIIEKDNQIVAPWHNHYHRLHLNSCKAISSLPYKKFDKAIPTYPSRQ